MLDSMKAADYQAIRQSREIWDAYRKTLKPGSRVNLDFSDLRDVNMRGADLRDANLRAADLRDANLTRANLTRANLTGANLARASLRDADLAYADVSRGDLALAHLRAATLTGANLASANLTGANLTGANLTGVELTRSDLTSADLTSANLTGADLTSANLTGANLTGADLTSANLTGANLLGGNLNGAKLVRGNLTGTNITGANLTGVHLGSTILADLDVSALCDAENLRHGGSSYVDLNTIIRTHAHPHIKNFLHSCGWAWIFSEYMLDCAKAVTAEDLRALMQSTFISYGQPDDAFARQLYESLINRKITVFYFPETARWGERLSNEVHTQLNRHDRVILICSEDSLNRLGVLNEIQETLDREAHDGGADYLLPIALDDYLFDPNGWERVQPELTRRIRARVVGDFREWQASITAYDKALNRLIDALKRFHP